MIVINVDIAGNGRAGASSKCAEAGNEPHQFLRCQLFDGAAAEMGMTGAGLLGRSCPQLAAGCKQTHRSCPQVLAAGCKHTPALPWGGPVLLLAGGWPWEAGNGPSSVRV